MKSKRGGGNMNNNNNMNLGSNNNNNLNNSDGGDYNMIIIIVIALIILGVLVYFGYKYITSPNGQEKIKKQILNELKGNMPNLINKELPKFTQPALPTKPKTKISI